MDEQSGVKIEEVMDAGTGESRNWYRNEIAHKY